MIEKCLTERIAKRIRRGQSWSGKTTVSDELIVKWAKQYADIRRVNHAVQSNSKKV